LHVYPPKLYIFNLKFDFKKQIYYIEGMIDLQPTVDFAAAFKTTTFEKVLTLNQNKLIW